MNRVTALLGGAALTAASLMVVASMTAYAAPLGGLTTTSMFVASPTPVAYASMSDDFTTAGGPRQSINARVLPTGQQWSAVNNTFAVQAGDVSPWNNASTVRLATLPWVSAPTTTVTATLTGSGAYNFGLALHADVATGTAMVLRLRQGEIAEIAVVQGGTMTVLASGTGNVNATWSLTFNNGTYAGVRNGTPVVSYDASALPGRPTFATAGLFLQGGITLSWDDLSVVTP